jgi:hypothetical protein
MLRALLFACVIFPVTGFAEPHKLDSSQRAQQESLTLTLDTTKSKFRQMQRHHRQSDFQLWQTRLSQLNKGMTEKQVTSTLHAKELSFRSPFNNGSLDYYLLDDAYFATIIVDRAQRFLDATPPIAIAYRFTRGQ